MVSDFPIALDSPPSGGIAAAILVAILVLLLRRRTIAKRPAILFAIGSTLLAIASSVPVWNWPVVGTVAVLVDLSPSTRGATFRDRAALDQRIAKLLGKTPFKLFAFADRLRPLPAGPIDADMPADRTVLTAPPCDAIVLFSDGQFAVSSGLPPTYPVIDPALDTPADAAVTGLETTSEIAHAVVVQNGPRRTGNWTGATPTADVLSAIPTANEVRYTLLPGDLWPENDSLSIRRPPPPRATRWWVGDAAPPNWSAIKPADLPSDSSDYLGPAVIVLNDVAATDLSTAQMDALSRYVREFGGGLVIVGGPHAFGAGGYDRTPLDNLSPLASAPPDPAARWVILVDGSGSMASSVPGGSTAWLTESTAAQVIVASLPATDHVTIGSFAANITPWVSDVASAAIDSQKLPPIGLGPHGPTNLQAALESFTTIDSPLATRVLLMTDADALLTGPEVLAAKLSARHVSLSVLATGDGPALSALRSIVAATHGAIVDQPDPTKWISAARSLARAARPDGLRETKLSVTLDAPLVGSVDVSQWNPTWLRDKSTVIARSPERPMAATWNAGIGRVGAVAWRADSSIVETLAGSVAALPGDPRLKVTIDAGPTIRIAVDAVDGLKYLNDLHVTAAIGEGSGKVSVPLVRPGYYEAILPASRDPALATIWSDERAIGRFAIAGRYPPEFDAIGNNRVALAELASRTGGRVVEPGPVSPIDFRWPTRSMSLFTPLVVAGLLAIGVGLVMSRRTPE